MNPTNLSRTGEPPSWTVPLLGRLSTRNSVQGKFKQVFQPMLILPHALAIPVYHGSVIHALSSPATMWSASWSNINPFLFTTAIQISPYHPSGTAAVFFPLLSVICMDSNNPYAPSHATNNLSAPPVVHHLHLNSNSLFFQEPAKTSSPIRPKQQGVPSARTVQRIACGRFDLRPKSTRCRRRHHSNRPERQDLMHPNHQVTIVGETCVSILLRMPVSANLFCRPSRQAFWTVDLLGFIMSLFPTPPCPSLQ